MSKKKPPASHKFDEIAELSCLNKQPQNSNAALALLDKRPEKQELSTGLPMRPTKVSASDLQQVEKQLDSPLHAKPKFSIAQLRQYSTPKPRTEKVLPSLLRLPKKRGRSIVTEAAIQKAVGGEVFRERPPTRQKFDEAEYEQYGLKSQLERPAPGSKNNPQIQINQNRFLAELKKLNDEYYKQKTQLHRRRSFMDQIEDLRQSTSVSIAFACSQITPAISKSRYYYYQMLSYRVVLYRPVLACPTVTDASRKLDFLNQILIIRAKTIFQNITFKLLNFIRLLLTRMGYP